MRWSEVNFPTPADAAWGDMCRRRCDLVRRNYEFRNLTSSELWELDVLQSLTHLAANPPPLLKEDA